MTQKGGKTGETHHGDVNQAPVVETGQEAMEAPQRHPCVLADGGQSPDRSLDGSLDGNPTEARTEAWTETRQKPGRRPGQKPGEKFVRIWEFRDRSLNF
jgi:hypothetical protein